MVDNVQETNNITGSGRDARRASEFRKSLPFEAARQAILLLNAVIESPT
jgi:hypothetical protein